MTDDNIAALFEPADWAQRAACRGIDPDLFFPERGQDTEPAKTVCRTCPVIDACLDHALRNGERVGVWGGTSERERRKMRQQWAGEHDRWLSDDAGIYPLCNRTDCGLHLVRPGRTECNCDDEGGPLWTLPDEWRTK